ncbi:hypothetical protein M885DRAFT_77009 [Pelagophyceae sp. CCMP2097]|nr:hypothetical protein M885DRAFT_77009 [Pelagophyceae sp. CCMP2097]
MRVLMNQRSMASPGGAPSSMSLEQQTSRQRSQAQHGHRHLHGQQSVSLTASVARHRKISPRISQGTHMPRAEQGGRRADGGLPRQMRGAARRWRSGRSSGRKRKGAFAASGSATASDRNRALGPPRRRAGRCTSRRTSLSRTCAIKTTSGSTSDEPRSPCGQPGRSLRARRTTTASIKTASSKPRPRLDRLEQGATCRAPHPITKR